MHNELNLHPNIPKFLAQPKRMLINGQWVESTSGKQFETLNPATREVLTKVAEGDKEDINCAVQAARKAFAEGPWSRMKPNERSRLIYKLADLIEQNADELAQLETLDNGKPVRESRYVDIPSSCEHFRYYAGWVTKITGETFPVSAPGNFLNYTRREPIGVVGQIVPWNFPLLMAAWKLAPALACGNTIVFKPAEQTPLTTLRLGELIQEAGFPDGVVNIVTGFGETAGAALVKHEDVDKIAFTGSTEVGKIIVGEAKGNLKKVSLELGGKNPNIIFADADLSKAIPAALAAIFFNQGEVCTSGSRLYVERKIYDQVISAMTEAIQKIKLGNGLMPSTEMGPLVSEEQLKRVNDYIEIGQKEGAEIYVGGLQSDETELSKGYFVKPTIFTNVDDQMTIAKEEIFGPVLSVLPFDNTDDVICRANHSTFGLAAGVWTKDVSKAHRVANALESGTVWVNAYGLTDAASPFGGYKQSGIGREMGSTALDLYTQIKSIWVNID